MSTITLEAAPGHRVQSRRISIAHLTTVELRKMFDTRSGFWLMASIAIAAVLATTAAIIFAPEDELTYSTFASAIGIPIAIILPMIAILSVTSEWSQRSGLTTFTLVPHRHSVVIAKGIASIGVGAVSVLLAFAIGAVGNVVGSAITGVDTVWDASVRECLSIILANVLGLLIGFMLGVLIRNSPGALVAYFIYSGVLPSIFAMLAASQDWFQELQPWVSFSYAQGALFDTAALTSTEWAQLGVTGILWLLIPMGVGVWLLMRSEVK